MEKYDITCPHRKANPYKRMMKATKEHAVLPNLLNREFKQEIPGKVPLTDISYLFFKHGQKAYLSTILDASTNEVLSYNVSKSLKIDIVTTTYHSTQVSICLPGSFHFVLILKMHYLHFLLTFLYHKQHQLKN